MEPTQTQRSSTEPTTAPGRRAPDKLSGARSAASTIGVIAAAFLVAISLTLYVFQSYQVDGPSMETSLQNGDRLIIWKVPRTVARLSGNDYIPNRGDIIVFVEKGVLSPDGSSKQLIKRVIGLPGDRVVVADGSVTVYNEEYPDGFQPDLSLPYGENKDLSINQDERDDETVGDNQVYVLGDNRSNSLDSRSFGLVDSDAIIGKLVLRMYPLKSAERF